MAGFNLITEVHRVDTTDDRSTAGELLGAGFANVAGEPFRLKKHTANIGTGKTR
jgi:hypothetical protein